MTKSKRINARISESTEKKLLEIIQATGSNMSQVIAEAIEKYYEQSSLSRLSRPYNIFKESGLIGCAEGPGNLSQDYKTLLSADLKKKHGYR